MLKTTFLLVFMALLSPLYASHIVGGEMFYDCLGGNQYRITVKLYRDCFSDGAEFDDNLPITVFNASNVQIDNFYIPFPGKTLLDVTFDNPCVTIPPDICVEEAIYQQVVTLPDSPGGYTLAYQRCCRGPEVLNLDDPANQGLTLTVDIPPAADAVCNNSARFKNYPPLLLCTNYELEFDHSAIDPDGDELVYELCTPFQGGTSTAPAPDPASPPPYDFVNWAGGITFDDPFGAGYLSIDPVTGLLTGNPEMAGLYAVGVCVKEYRAGVLISTTRRDFLFKVFNCEITMESIVTPQLELSTFETVCGGLTVEFENESYGGTNYLWDFGDGVGTSTEFAPTYTYPGEGTYDVMLVVNPGWPCTDTSIESFTVNNAISATFDPPAPQCIVGNSFDFFGDGEFPTDGTTSYLWNFGPDATPSTSTDLNPTGIVFGDSGPQNVTFSISYDVCNEEHTEEVFVYMEPTIGFSVPDELKCAPYKALFTNYSEAHTPMYYLWDFGDGIGTSSEENPHYWYNDVGVYDVTLTVWTTEGCIDTLTLLRPNLIETFPSPTSTFTVTPDVQDEFNADFYFEDFSEGGVSSSFHFADGDWSPLNPVWHNYKEPGVYYPWQIVTNEYGCQDRSYEQVTVVPVIPVLVPNAFSPDGNSINPVFKPVWYSPIPFEMWIYNRWGELVYFSDEVEGSWDGYDLLGNLVQDGTYVWKIKYLSFKDGKTPIEIQGHVTVLK